METKYENYEDMLEAAREEYLAKVPEGMKEVATGQIDMVLDGIREMAEKILHLQINCSFHGSHLKNVTITWKRKHLKCQRTRKLVSLCQHCCLTGSMSIICLMTEQNGKKSRKRKKLKSPWKPIWKSINSFTEMQMILYLQILLHLPNQS